MAKSRKKSNHIIVKVYELSGVREVPIDLSSGKDRRKLKHIIQHEGHRLRKRDLDRYTQMLNA